MSCCFFGGGDHNFCCLSDVFQRQQDPKTLLLGRGRSCFVGGMLLVARNASNNLAENQSSLSSSSQSIPEEPSKSPLGVQLSWQAIASLSMLCVFSILLWSKYITHWIFCGNQNRRPCATHSRHLCIGFRSDLNPISHLKSGI